LLEIQYKNFYALLRGCLKFLNNRKASYVVAEKIRYDVDLFKENPGVHPDKFKFASCAPGFSSDSCEFVYLLAEIEQLALKQASIKDLAALKGAKSRELACMVASLRLVKARIQFNKQFGKMSCRSWIGYALWVFKTKTYERRFQKRGVDY